MSEVCKAEGRTCKCACVSEFSGLKTKDCKTLLEDCGIFFYLEEIFQKTRRFFKNDNICVFECENFL